MFTLVFCLFVSCLFPLILEIFRYRFFLSLSSLLKNRLHNDLEDFLLMHSYCLYFVLGGRYYPGTSSKAHQFTNVVMSFTCKLMSIPQGWSFLRALFNAI